MHKKKIPPICVFVCLLFGNCAPAPRLCTDCSESYTFRNGMPCTRFMQEHLSDGFLGVTFSQRPAVSAGKNFWILTWNGIEVPLPRTAYEHVFFFKGSAGGYNVHLTAGDHFQISLIENRNELYADVFAVANPHDRSSETTMEGIAATKALFGGAVRFSELMMLAYASTPEEITCCKATHAEEMRTVVALIMKRIDRPDIVAVYKGVGRHSGWITASASGDQMEYALNIVPEKDAAKVFHIIYEMPAKTPFHDIPFLVGSAGRSVAAPPPGWVAALNLALQEDSNEAWRRYIDAAGAANLNPASIHRVEDMLPLPDAQ